MVDLHVHSDFSDGTVSPEELVREAAGIGLKALALTDHDTMAGWRRFVRAAKAAGVRPVLGVELSAAHEHGPLHILGYFPRPTPRLCAALRRLRQGRRERNEAILARLRALGLGVGRDDVLRQAGVGAVGRLHFARALVEIGCVQTAQEAFDRWLARGRPAYVDRFRFSAAETIAMLRSAGAVTVLAHPGLLRCKGAHLRALVAELREAGLDGLEVWHSRHVASGAVRLRALAERYGLLATGGSDYHGRGEAGVRLGAGTAGMSLPLSLLAGLDRLRSRPVDGVPFG